MGEKITRDKTSTIDKIRERERTCRLLGGTTCEEEGAGVVKQCGPLARNIIYKIDLT